MPSSQGPIIHYRKATWAQLASITEDVEVALTDSAGVCSGIVVRRDPRLQAVGYVPSETWIPRQLVRRGTPWVLRTAWHYSLLNPAAPPAGWTWDEAGGAHSGGSGVELHQTANIGRSAFIYGIGVVLSRMFVLIRMRGMTVAGLDLAGVMIGFDPLACYYCPYFLSGVTPVRNLKYTAVVYPDILPASLQNQTHYINLKNPIAKQDSSTISVPSLNNSLVRIDGLGAWNPLGGTGVYLRPRSYAGITDLYTEFCAVYTQ
jgi:hypothetical protein